MTAMDQFPRISVLIPCYNEEKTVAKVVSDFRDALPSATVFVFDNNSTDATVECAQTAGAIVRSEKRQGKGNVVRRMFSDIDADIYIIVDGDATYDASAAPEIVRRMLDEGLDFLNCVRVTELEAAYRPGHKFGNLMFTGMVRSIFGTEINDMLSGYKGLSKRFVKSFPALSQGFETETELAVHALELRMPIGELRTSYFDRPDGSESKLSTFRDGWRILRTVARLIRDERPLAFFSVMSALAAIVSLAFGLPVVYAFMKTGLVLKFPTAILAASLMMISMLSLVAGLILDTTTRGRREMKRLHYLSFPSIHAELMRRAKDGPRTVVAAERKGVAR